MLKPFQVHANTNKVRGVLNVALASESNAKSKDVLVACTPFLQKLLQYCSIWKGNYSIQGVHSMFSLKNAPKEN